MNPGGKEKEVPPDTSQRETDISSDMDTEENNFPPGMGPAGKDIFSSIGQTFDKYGIEAFKELSRMQLLVAKDIKNNSFDKVYLFYNSGVVLLELDKCQIALDILKRALKMLEVFEHRVSIEDEENTEGIKLIKTLRASIQERLGFAYEKLGILGEEALRQLKGARLIFDAENWNNDEIYAEMFNRMGVCELNLENYDKASNYFDDAEELYNKFKLPKTTHAHSLHNIGTICQKKGDYKEAYKKHNTALVDLRDEDNENKEDIAASLLWLV